MRKWCEHIIYEQYLKNVGWVYKAGNWQIIDIDFKFCPWCGKPRPKGK